MILQGKTFISTVSNVKSFGLKKIFEPLGALLVDFPMTDIIESEMTPEIENALREVERFQWIIFTSANGVKYFHRRLYETLKLPSIPSSVKIAAIGTKTALEVKSTGRPVDYTGSGGNAESLINEMIEKELIQDCRVLLPLGNLAPDSAQDRLTGISDVIRINIYETVKTGVSDKGPIEMISNNMYDLVLFTSPSAVINFAETLGPRFLNPELRSASIGEFTTKAARQYGLRCLITAKTSTYEGLANEIINYYKIKN